MHQPDRRITFSEMHQSAIDFVPKIAGIKIDQIDMPKCARARQNRRFSILRPKTARAGRKSTISPDACTTEISKSMKSKCTNQRLIWYRKLPELKRTSICTEIQFRKPNHNGESVHGIHVHATSTSSHVVLLSFSVSAVHPFQTAELSHACGT